MALTAIILSMISVIMMVASGYGLGIEQHSGGNTDAYKASISFLVIGIFLYLVGTIILYNQNCT